MKYSGERIYPSDPAFKKHTTMQSKHIYLYSFAKKFISRGLVLDAGCAAGFGTSHLLPTKAKKIIGLEIDKEAVKFAKQHYNDEKLMFEQGNLTNLRFGNNVFSTTICIDVIEHIKDPGKALKETVRVIKADGVLIISTPNKEAIKNQFTDTPNNPFHEFEFTLDEFFDFLSHDFDEVEMYYQDKVVKQSSNLKTIFNFFIALDVLKMRKFLLHFFGIGIGERFALTTACKGDFSIRRLKRSDFKDNELPAYFVAVCKKPKK